jgi:hypothetical protein
MAQVTHHAGEAQITTVRHSYPHTDWPVTTKFARRLDSIHSKPLFWLVKQSDGYVTNQYDCVVDDFGSLVPVQQCAGFIMNNGRSPMFLGV